MEDRSPSRRPRILSSGAAVAAIGVGLVALTLGSDSGARAADPDRPFKVFGPFVARDEGATAPSPKPPSTPVPAPGAGSEINLQPELDTANAVSKLVTYAEGATLTTTGADGSKYTLTLPPHSILMDETVTMTPLKAAGGLPAGSSLGAGVQLEPDGLALGVPATLDIVAANPVPVGDEISFSYSGDGHQAHAYPLGVNASRTRFELLHFSGWGIGSGTTADRRALFQSKVDSLARQLSQEAAAAVSAERARQAAEGTPSDVASAAFMESVFESLRRVYSNLVQPAMDSAEELADSGAIDAVEPGLQAMYRWERQLELVGLFRGDGFLDDERQALREQENRILDKLRQNMRDRCFSQHEVKWGRELFVLSRRQILSGRSGEQAFDDADRCLTFKLDFETTIAVGPPGQSVWQYHVQVVGMPIRLLTLFSTEAPPVTQPLDLLSFSGPPPPPTCTFDGSGVHPTDPFEVRKATLVAVRGPFRRPDVGDVEMTIWMGDLGGSVSYHCPRGTLGPNPLPDGGMRGFFNSFHIADFGPGGIVARGWEMVRGDVYAVKTYQQTTAIGREDTIFELRHTPE